MTFLRSASEVGRATVRRARAICACQAGNCTTAGNRLGNHRLSRSIEPEDLSPREADGNAAGTSSS
eukprot:4391556-Lingulodinium_polyedra.AAC.1